MILLININKNVPMLRQFGKTKSFKKTLILFCDNITTIYGWIVDGTLHTNKSLINILNDLKDAQTSKRATFFRISRHHYFSLYSEVSKGSVSQIFFLQTIVLWIPRSIVDRINHRKMAITSSLN